MQKGSKDEKAHAYCVLTPRDAEFPEKLQHLFEVPKRLYVKGDAKLLTTSPIVGIVGSRKLTPYGREVTDQIARTLAEYRIPVVSGLALGVDSVAHRACVNVGGQTIAVLPGGIDLIYPSTHRDLAKQIVKTGGTLVSEYADTVPSMQYRFIERNRIIAALSDVLIITEAAENSGSLHTARFALELGKTIMAVPGPITSPYSRGTNRLVQTGAIPLLDPNDVFEVLGLKKEDISAAYLPENEAEAAILASLEQGITASNDLLRACELETNVFQTHLTMLEIKGVLEVSSGHWRIR